MEQNLLEHFSDLFLQVVVGTRLMSMGPEGAPQGKLPPCEITKSIAFEQIIIAMERRMGKSCWEILGTSRAMFASQHLKLVGGGRPSDKAV